MLDETFRRVCSPASRDSRVLIDTRLQETDYVESFGLEWTEFDGFANKESLSHGHIFGRFLLSDRYFEGKTVADIGCGNGRIGRLVAPKAGRYIGVDLSQAIYSFPKYLRQSNLFLVQASATDLPLADAVSDVTVCWGVLHHTDHPHDALDELIRITKAGGEIIVFVYSKAYAGRENFNHYVKSISVQDQHKLIENASDLLDSWRDVDAFFSTELSNGVHMSIKNSRDWQIFQWFDGITPQYHWSLEPLLETVGHPRLAATESYGNGCYKLRLKS